MARLPRSRKIALSCAGALAVAFWGLAAASADDAVPQGSAESSVAQVPNDTDVTDVLPSRDPASPAVSGTSGAARLASFDEQTASDATTQTVPGYVDEYGTIFRSMVTLRGAVRDLAGRVAHASVVVSQLRGALQTATLERDAAKDSSDRSRVRVNASVRDLYIRGAGGVEGVIGVLSSGPNDFVTNANVWKYLTSMATDDVDRYRSNSSLAATAELDLVVATRRLAEATTDLTTLQQQYADAMSALQGQDSQLATLLAWSQSQIQTGADGCPSAWIPGVVPAGLDLHALCTTAVLGAPTIQAAQAMQWALGRLGAPYACGGVGRLEPFRFDCSSYVSRAYSEGAGLSTTTSGWAPSTRNMVPWDGFSLDDHYVAINPEEIRPGDLVLYDTCPTDGSPCPYRHVVMYLGHLVPDGPAYMA
ncbi:MAG: NlpC/P60 family protein, partial [Candidatus Nanopelagicales bacterium]|nr:NlpC/P60 family protein [Candidatus Nanopelagicales bacterium]